LLQSPHVQASTSHANVQGLVSRPQFASIRLMLSLVIALLPFPPFLLISLSRDVLYCTLQATPHRTYNARCLLFYRLGPLSCGLSQFWLWQCRIPLALVPL